MENTSNFDSIAEQIYKKGAVFLIGAGASEYLGYPSSEALAETIGDYFKIDTPCSGLKDVVDRVLEKTKRQELVDWIGLEFKSIAEKEDRGIFNNPYHYLAVISKEILEKNRNEGRATNLYFFTTNFDGQLVRGFEKELITNKEFEVFTSNDDFATRKNAPVHIYLLHGDINVKTNGNDSLVLTDDDLRDREPYNGAMYVDFQYALQHFPLFIIGHSARDVDIRGTYDTVRKRIKNTVTFEVNPAGSSLRDTTPLETELLPFLYALASSVNKLYGMNIPIPHQPIVRLSYYDDFMRKVEDSVGKSKSILIYGHYFSGKSTFINYLYAEGKIPPKYKRMILRTFSGSDTGRKEVRELIKASSIAEATHYEREWFLGNEESINSISFLKSIANHFGKKIKMPEDGNIANLEIKIYYSDAEKLLNHYLSIYGADSNISVNVEKKRKLISLGSYGGLPPKKNGERGGILIPPLLERVVRDHKNEDTEALKKIEEAQRQQEKLVEEVLGFSILDSLAAGADVAHQSTEFLKRSAGTFLSVLATSPGVPLAGLVILGVSSIMNFYRGQKNEGLKRYTDVFKYWNDLPIEKRVIIAEELDRKSKIPPGSSYSFLSHWLSKGGGSLDEESEKFLRKMETVFTDDFVAKIKEVVDELPFFKPRLEELEERVNDLEDMLRKVKKEMADVKEEMGTLRKYINDNNTKVNDLITANAKKDKRTLLKSLEYENDDEKLGAWLFIDTQIEKGIINVEDVKSKREGFVSLLTANTEWVRVEAWNNLETLVEKGIINVEDIKASKDGLLSLLASNPDWKRYYAWLHIDTQIEKGIINVEDVKSKREGFVSLLTANTKWVRVEAWNHLEALVEKGIINVEDIKASKDGLIKVLKSYDLQHRLEGWKIADTMISRGVVNLEDIKTIKRYFLSLLKSDTEWIRREAVGIIDTLIDRGIIEDDDIKTQK